MVWKCSVCTFENLDPGSSAFKDGTRCEMCGQKRHGESAEATNDGIDEDEDDEVVCLGESSAPKAKKPKARSLLSSLLPSSAIAPTRTKRPPTKKATQQQTLFGTRAETIDLTENNKSSNRRTNIPATAASKSTSRKRKAPGSTTPAPIFSSAAAAASSSSTHAFPQKTLSKESSRAILEAGLEGGAVQNTLESVFGLESLRNLQPMVVECALRQQSQLLVMATGGGKSLCYQLPACLLGGVTFVISPLIALMQDQVQALNAKGIPAALVSSQQTAKQNQQILDRVLGIALSKPEKCRSSGETTLPTPTLLYITPESIQTDRMRDLLAKLHKENRLTMFAVDEAHCLSSWGHDFRPAYRRLDWLRKRFPGVPCMACTATATPQVIKDIQETLQLHKAPLFKGSFDRPNIFYKVRYKDAIPATASGGGPMQDMISWIVKQHAKHHALGQKCSGIVYVHKREDTSMIARRITLESKSPYRDARSQAPPVVVKAEPYHAGLKKADRNRILEEWSTDKVQVAVATVAFGMGIDLAHVRYVVHWTLPKTVEGFYQESGRAGRDGLPSHSLLYYSQDDAKKFQFLLQMQHQNSSSKDKDDAASRKRKEEALERKLAGLESMVKYCITPSCRRNGLIGHFGGDKADCRKTCDYCREPKKVERAIQTALVAKDSLGGGRSSFRGRRGSKKNAREWDGQWSRPHGDGVGDEEKIARDWGDKTVVDGLRLTDSASSKHAYSGGDLYDDFDAEGSLKLKAKPASGRAGFVKATSILDKYEAMETKRGSGFVHFRSKPQGSVSGAPDDDQRPSTAMKIPEHFRARITSTQNQKLAKTKPKAPEPTSVDHARKAVQLRKDLEKLNAEREARMKALLAKRKSRSATKT